MYIYHKYTELRDKMQKYKKNLETIFICEEREYKQT